MSVQWTRHGQKLDATLAVAFEMGHRRLVAAKSPRQLDQAITYNLRLWRTARRLAERGSGVSAREDVTDTADLVATLLVLEPKPLPDPRDVDFVAGRNLSIARELAEGSAAARARDTLISEWTTDGSGSFEDWLLTKVEEGPRPFE